MSLTISDLLTLEPFRDTELVAGAAGLDRPVAHVTVVEVPDCSRWGCPGGLAISTLYSCPDVDLQRNLLVSLSNGGGAGLAIHPGTKAPQHLREMGETADLLGFPLLRLSPQVSYLSIFRAVYERILNHQAFLLRRSEEIHDQFAQLIVSGGTTKAIAETLHEMIQSTVLVFDQKMSTHLAWGGTFSRAQTLSRLIRASGLQSYVSSMQASPEAVIRHPAKGNVRNLYVALVRHGGKTARFLVTCDENGPLGDIELAAIKHAATALSMDVLRERVLKEAEMRIASNLLDGLLAGTEISLESVVRRGDSIGIDLRDRRVVLFVCLKELASADRAGSGMDHAPAEILLRAVEYVSTGLDPCALVISRAEGVIVLPSLPAGVSEDTPSSRASALAHVLREHVDAKLGDLRCLVGVGSVVESTLHIRWSYQTARWAATIAMKLGSRDGVAVFDNLGVYKLGVSLDTDLVSRFVSDTLSEVEDSIMQDAELVRTLEAFLDCGESFVAAADKLYVHPNTVKYRIEKIRHLVPAGLLAQSDQRLALRLALKLRRISQP
jgi:sugar diacid utilization regulator